MSEEKRKAGLLGGAAFVFIIVIIILLSLYKKDIITFGYVLLLLLMVGALEISAICLYKTILLKQNYKMMEKKAEDFTARLCRLEENSNLDENGSGIKDYKIESPIGIMQSQLENYMTTVNSVIAILGIVITLMTIGIPILNYAFLNRDQIELMYTKVDEKIKEMNDTVYLQSQIAFAQILESDDEKKTVYDDLVFSYPHNADVFYYRGDFYYLQKKYELAFNDYLMSLRLEPDNSTVETKSMECLYQLKRSDDLIEFCDNLVSQGSENEKIYFYRGLALDNLEEFEGAIEDYKKAVALNPSNYLYYYNMGVCYGENKKMDDALECYKKAIELNSSHSFSYNNIANIYYDKGEIDKAIECYSNAVKYDKTNDVAFKNRGMRYKDKGYYNDAISDFTSAIKIAPQNAKYYKYRAEAYMAQNIRNSFELARDDYDEAIRLNEKDLDSYLGRARAYQKLSKFELAREDCERVLKIDPDNKEVLFVRGKIESESGNYDEAIKNFTSFLEKKPEDYDALYARGSAYLYNAGYADALNDLNRALELLNQKKAEDKEAYRLTYYQLAQSYYFSGQYQPALELMQKSISYEKKYKSPYVFCAKTYKKLNNYSAAIDSYTDALAIDPKDTEILKERAKLYELTGEDELYETDIQKISIIEELDKAS